MEFLPLDQQLDDILFDLQFSQGQFSDDSLQSDERRELAVRLINDAIDQAGYGSVAYAGE